jgi:hypothetical protein
MTWTPTPFPATCAVATPDTVSWSVSAIAESPRAEAASTSSDGEKVPSDAVECKCKSIITYCPRARGSGGLARGRIDVWGRGRTSPDFARSMRGKRAERRGVRAGKAPVPSRPKGERGQVRAVGGMTQEQVRLGPGKRAKQSRETRPRKATVPPSVRNQQHVSHGSRSPE